MEPKTPYYLIDKEKLKKNLERIRYVREHSGAKSVLALKCFSTWSVFDLMKQYLDGTTSSSLYEARLGYETFGGEVHAYSVAFSDEDIEELRDFSGKVIFNSTSQLRLYYSRVSHLNVGVRINPLVSYSGFDLADPARRFSRLGVKTREEVLSVLDSINGVMFHYNCENDDFEAYAAMLDKIADNYGDILEKLDWVSLGGGVSFTSDGYPLDRFCGKLKEFSCRFGVKLYLEPGEAAITNSCTLVVKVLDIVQNEMDIAIVDSSIEAHMLDQLVYQFSSEVTGATLIKDPAPNQGENQYMIAGKTCLAGDIFGTYQFPDKLKVGDLIHFENAASYTMVKTNWFNGIRMPSIAIKQPNGTIEVVRTFSYEDYKRNLS